METTDSTAICSRSDQSSCSDAAGDASRAAASQNILDAALKEISAEDKAAYYQALAQAPNVVAAESPFELFLVTEDHNAIAAGKRLCRYWQERVDLFEERAFLPMNQTGSGALSQQDIDLLNTTLFVVLPPDTDTKQKRTVLAIDKAQLGRRYFHNVFLKSKWRSSFYLLHVACENPVTQTVGIVAIGVQGEANDEKHSKRIVSIVKNALPIRHLEFHFVFFPSRIQKLGLSSFIDDILSSSLGLLGFFSNWAFTHKGKTDQEVLQRLAERGFKTECLPTWYGGSWSLEDFANWRKQRILIEKGEKLSGEDKNLPKRQSNAVRSKKKRMRRKQEQELLQEKKKRLSSANASLKQANEYYEQVLMYAETEIAILTGIPGSTSAASEFLPSPVHPQLLASTGTGAESAEGGGTVLASSLMDSPYDSGLDEYIQPLHNLEWPSELKDLFQDGQDDEHERWEEENNASFNI